jgi:hypothetical protein
MGNGDGPGLEINGVEFPLTAMIGTVAEASLTTLDTGSSRPVRLVPAPQAPLPCEA